MQHRDTLTQMLEVKMKNKWFRLFSGFAVGLGIALLILQFDFYTLEFLSYDIRQRIKPKTPPSGLVSTLVIDQASLKILRRTPTVADHSQVLRKLLQQHPLYVLYLIDPSELVGTEQELREFAELATHPSVFFNLNSVVEHGLEEQHKFPPPLDTLKTLPGLVTIDRTLFAQDNVTRRLMLAYKGRLSTHAHLLKSLNGIQNVDEYRGSFKLPPTQQAFIDVRPKGTYPAHSFEQAINSKMKKELWEGKIVLIGQAAEADIQNYVQTPLSRETLALSTLEMHANIFDTLFLNTAPQWFSPWVNYIFTILVSLLTLFVVLNLQPLKGLVILLLLIVGYSALSVATALTTGFILPMAHPLVSVFFCYYFIIPYRLIIENRKSWIYQQKNQLLTQVEELKSNFLKMMSHDLKTPLARIQGMSEILLNDPQPLSEKQQEAVERISSSTQELTEFISSILNLNRIESKEIQLQVQSRDINSLLEKVIHKSEDLARQKDIRIIPDFEPLFSVQMDQDLLQQVFTNLIENAIKYSPDGTEIRVRTEEREGRVYVQVADQGVGISHAEQENIFIKFYRCKDASSSPIKGSGLGLYLSKYFVHLHRGDIFVESEPEKGSTFTVELPIEHNSGSQPSL